MPIVTAEKMVFGGDTNNEWFKCTLNDIKIAVKEVKDNKRYDGNRTEDFTMRREQENAVKQTMFYCSGCHKNFIVIAVESFCNKFTFKQAIRTIHHAEIFSIAVIFISRTEGNHISFSVIRDQPEFYPFIFCTFTINKI